jgi:hypothetical protein
MTDPIAQLRAMRNELADLRHQFRNHLDPSRPVLIGIDAETWIKRLDDAMSEIADERAGNLEIVG